MNLTTSNRYWSKIQFTMINLIKNPLFLIFIVNMIIRIPHIAQNAIGNDAFIVQWMARAINIGYFEPWLLHPLAIFGFYPISFYPIGGPIILSLFYSLGFSINLAFYLFSILFLLIAIVTCYSLARYLFPKNNYAIYFFILFYTTSSIFLRFTFWTASVRGPFLAILPLVIHTHLKLYDNFSGKNLIMAIFSVVLLALMHRLSILYPLYLASLLLAYILIKINFKFLTTPKIYFLIYPVLLIAGIETFPIDANKTVEVILKNDNIVGKIWNLLVDYGTRFGLISLLAAWGFLKQGFLKDNNKSFHYLFFVILGMFLIFLSPVTRYVSIIALPFICYLAVIGLMDILNNNSFYFSKYFVAIFPIMSGIIYSLLLSTSTIYIFLSILLLVCGVYWFIKNKRAKVQVQLSMVNQFTFLLISSILLMSIVTTDGLIITQEKQENPLATFPYAFLSLDEIIMANVLNELNSESNYITVAYHGRIARRISALTFQPALFANIDPVNLYYGWFSKQAVLERSIYDPSELLKSGIPFKFFLSNRLFLKNGVAYQIFNYNLSQNNNLNFMIEELGIKYFILQNLKLLDNQIPTGISTLFQSVYSIGRLIISTKFLSLYEIVV